MAPFRQFAQLASRWTKVRVRVQSAAVLLWPEKHQRTDPIISQFHASNATHTGGQSMGDITMADSEERKERRNQVARYRLMEQEATDPLAVGLLRDIVSELEGEMDEQRTAACGRALEPAVIEFHGRTISCLVRNLSESGAALDVTGPGEIPDRFTLALPFEGVTHRCSLIWRREMEIGVSFEEKESRRLDS
jgi:hypothetical protein